MLMVRHNRDSARDGESIESSVTGPAGEEWRGCYPVSGERQVIGNVDSNIVALCLDKISAQTAEYIPLKGNI